MIRIRPVLLIIAMILTLLLLLTLLFGLIYNILAIPTSGFIKTLSYSISSYGLPALGLILLFIVKLEGKTDKN